MSFAAPTYLLALALLPLLAGVYALERRRRRRYVIRFPAAGTLAAVIAAVPAWRRRVPPALLALAGIALAVALARPERTVAVPIERASVMLVTDESGSMFATDVAPSRLAAAQGAANRFLDRVPDQLLVGFVAYSSGPQTVLEPTTDHGSIRSAVEALRADGGTATGDALTTAIDRLAARRAGGRTAPAAIVLLSDGKTTEGTDPIAAARRAGTLHIPIYTVALGTPDGIVNGPFGEQISVPPDPETLRQIALRSGGQAFQVADAGQLDRVYQRLGSRIGSKHQRQEISAAFAAGGLVLLLGGLGTGLRWRGQLS